MELHHSGKSGRRWTLSISILKSLANDELTTTDNTPNDRSQLSLSQISAQRRGGRDMVARQTKWSANSVIGTFLLFFPRGCSLHFSFSILILEAGAGGGLVASIATCPLDVIKTKLQAQRAVQGQQAYLGVFGAFAHPVPFHSQAFNPVLLLFYD